VLHAAASRHPTLGKVPVVSGPIGAAEGSGSIHSAVDPDVTLHNPSATARLDGARADEAAVREEAVDGVATRKG
jgi:hypothetical protein